MRRAWLASLACLAFLGAASGQSSSANCAAAGADAARKGALDAAAECFEACLAQQPGDPAISRELALVRAEIERRRRLAETVAAAQTALDRGDWAALDGLLGGLPARDGDPALVAAFAAYAAGDKVRAASLADIAAEAGNRAAHRFSEALRGEMRRAYFRRWLAPAVGGYLALLLASIYFGLRRVNSGGGNRV